MKPFKKTLRAKGKKRRRVVVGSGAIDIMIGQLRIKRQGQEIKPIIPFGVPRADCNVVLEWWE